MESYAKIKMNGKEMELFKLPKIAKKDYQMGGPTYDGFTVYNSAQYESELDEWRRAGGVGTHVFGTGNGHFYVPTGGLYVEYTSEAALKELIRISQLKVVSKDVDAQCAVLEITEASPNPIKVVMFGLEQLQEGITVLEPELATDAIFYSLALPDDNWFPYQWHLKNTSQQSPYYSSAKLTVGADAKIVEAWQELDAYSSAKIRIAVIDDGFDLNHADFQGRIVSPYYAGDGSSNAGYQPGQNHGTAVAGVALAGINGKGTVGAAPEAELIPIKFYYISDSLIEKMFQHATANGADVITNSWGAADPNYVMSTRIHKAINEAAATGRNGNGTVILFAAGNEARKINVGSFAAHPDVFAIGATNSKDILSTYSNYGVQLFATAPSNGSGGAGILTTDIEGSHGYMPGNYTFTFGGTSSATPLVAGGVALLLSANNNLTTAQVMVLIKDTADKIGGDGMYNDPVGPDHSLFYGYGRVNFGKAMNLLKTTYGFNFPDTPPTSNEIPLEVNDDKFKYRGLVRSTLSSEKGKEYIANVSAGTYSLTLLDQIQRQTGIIKDYDVYIDKDKTPTFSSFLFKADTTTKNEVLLNMQLETGTYHIVVYAKSGDGDFILVLSEM